MSKESLALAATYKRWKCIRQEIALIAQALELEEELAALSDLDENQQLNFWKEGAYRAQIQGIRKKQLELMREEFAQDDFIAKLGVSWDDIHQEAVKQEESYRRLRQSHLGKFTPQEQDYYNFLQDKLKLDRF